MKFDTKCTPMSSRTHLGTRGLRLPHAGQWLGFPPSLAGAGTNSDRYILSYTLQYSEGVLVPKLEQRD